MYLERSRLEITEHNQVEGYLLADSRTFGFASELQVARKWKGSSEVRETKMWRCRVRIQRFWHPLSKLELGEKTTSARRLKSVGRLAFSKNKIIMWINSTNARGRNWKAIQNPLSVMYEPFVSYGTRPMLIFISQSPTNGIRLICEHLWSDCLHFLVRLLASMCQFFYPSVIGRFQVMIIIVNIHSEGDNRWVWLDVCVIPWWYLPYAKTREITSNLTIFTIPTERMWNWNLWKKIPNLDRHTSVSHRVKKIIKHLDTRLHRVKS